MASQSSRNLANNNILFYRRRRSGAAGSAAFELLKEWGPDGLVLDFQDDFFEPTTGFYGSAAIAGGGTQDGYNSSPTKVDSSLLTYTAPSAKLTRGPDGNFRYQAHNLYLNSAAPANQSITVLSGATYAVTITGSVSVTASGAATGTWTAGTNTFTAATGTLTLGSTSGAGTVHVRRTPSDPTYLATTSAARYALPLEWDANGALNGLLVEETRTNICLYSNDLTQGNWTKYSVTAAKTATGPDGVANSASTLTATGNNGFLRQATFSASAARSGSVKLKRRTGTGAVSLAFGETTGSDLVTNGTFDTDTTGWTAYGTSLPTLSVSSGQLVVTNTGTTAGRGAYQAVTCEVGKLYRATATRVSATGTVLVALYVGVSAGSGSAGQQGSLGNGVTGTVSFVATATTMYISLNDSGTDASSTITFDNVTCREIVETVVDLSSGNWVRAKVENKTITDPCFGIKLATSGDAVDVAYSQMETGAFTTSPIETFASTVTRAADNISLATSAFPSIGSAGTIYVRAKSNAPTGTKYALFIGTNGNNFGAIRNDTGTTTQGIVFNGGGLVAAPVVGNWTAGNFQKVALRLETNNTNICSGGTLGTNDTSCAMPSYTTLRIGSDSAGFFDGIISQVIVLPRAMSNAELQALTGS